MKKKMIKNKKILEKFENDLRKKGVLSVGEKFKIYDEMEKWANKFQSKKNITEEIKHKIDLAKIINKIK